ncbi:MAG: hypothetical protein PVJ68_08865, partial [Candidatus Thiodiazotropha sp.]
MKKSIKLFTIAFAALLLAAPVLGGSHSGHSTHGHDDLASSANQGVGKGVLHEIDVENRIVNLTHQPIPEINW